MNTLYNEIEPFAVDWLRGLIEAGAIGPGEVDARSIADLETGDLARADRVHLFAGIGAWDYALRLAGLAGVPGIWTGSPPCQPFSVAGKQRGTKDDRHLWPEMRRLIEIGRPAIVFGEQTASPAGRAWLDVVRSEMEDLGYAFAASDLCAAGVGAPHIRQRLFFGGVRVADGGEGLEGYTEHVRRVLESRREPSRPGRPTASSSSDGGLDIAGRERLSRLGLLVRPGRQNEDAPETAGPSEGYGLGNADGLVAGWDAGAVRSPQRESPFEGVIAWRLPDGAFAPDAVRGAWGGSDWLLCRDPAGLPRWRPVEAGTFPLAYGSPGDLGRLRGYGNAIVAPLAAEFIGGFLDALADS